VHARPAWVEVVLGTAMLKVDGKVVATQKMATHNNPASE
jgi:hypothetical protein